MPVRLKKQLSRFHLAMGAKLTLAIGLIAVVLVVAAATSIVQFRRMSTHVAQMVMGNSSIASMSKDLSEAVRDACELAGGDSLSVTDMADSLSRVYGDISRYSVDFNESFYRGITPVIVSVAAGIMLCLLLLFFLISDYVRPLGRMLRSLDAYRKHSQPYHNVFDGDDELQELNSDIADLIDENTNLKKRLRDREC